MILNDPFYCPLIAGEYHRRCEINRNRVGKESESYLIPKVMLETNLDERIKSIDSNNKKFTAMGIKRETMRMPKNSKYSGIRNVKFQRNIAGYGVRKTHILHSFISSRNFSTGKDISKELDENLVKEKDICFKPNPNKVICNSENKPKITYAEVFTLDNILAGFEFVKNKKSVGIDKELKSDITFEKLKKLQKDLKTQKYKPKPSRRVAIPKPGGGERFLGIASTIDKVVQMVLVQQLQPIYESKFSTYSYGFRPKLGCHDALSKIRNGWQNVT
jgi:hypothetical protein